MQLLKELKFKAEIEISDLDGIRTHSGACSSTTKLQDQMGVWSLASSVIPVNC